MYKLSKKSLSKLDGVHPDLVKVVKHAIKICDVDFCVLEGMRTMARQKILVAAGASRTMKSRHLTGHAVDLGAMLNGKVRWDWPLYHRIAEAMKEAAIAEKVIGLTWGSAWDKPMEEFTKSPEEESDDYVLRRKTQGGKTFLDGPHYQLGWESYPLEKTS